MAENTNGHASVHRLAMVGTHLPRHCGIATFTSDLTDALTREIPEVDAFVVAMTEVGEKKHAYPSRVRFEIPEGDLEAYGAAADFLNVSAVSAVSIQHEYGIFGGRAGAHLLELLRGLRVPVVTTLHTILSAPDPEQRIVTEALLKLSERVVVMSTDGARLLQEFHHFDRARIDVIPHGIPAPPERPSKDRLGVEGRLMILTFGLLSPDKGIEHVIDAMPAIVERHPDAVYIVLGLTHPHVKRDHGEVYRHMLQARAERLGVAAHVIFHNRFVSQGELMEFLGAADIYITPYLNEAQSTSGTLAYAVGSGKAVISTPYRYAREMLDEERGILVPWRDSESIAREVNRLFDDPAARGELERRAAAFGRSMGWPQVARRYMSSFEQARSSFDKRIESGRAEKRLAVRRPVLPDLNLAHVRRMTDDTGLLQHATYDIPRLRDGYCTDDNARALLLVTHVEEAGTEAPPNVRALAVRYLAFLDYALDLQSGRFRNFMRYDRSWVDEIGSDDSHGRALWSLGTVVGRSRDRGQKALAKQLFHAALPGTLELGSPRAWAYTLLGIEEYVRSTEASDRIDGVRADLVSKLVDRLQQTRSAAWPWFEDRLTYCNARLSQALLVSAARAGDDDLTNTALRTLDWLVDHHSGKNGIFSPVGTQGFHVRGEVRAMFDQQPVEACAMVSACLDAHRVTGEARYLDTARRTFQWFLGHNVLEAQVYDARTGGCRDGIHAASLNENQGAESTLSFLIALAEIRAVDRVAVKLASDAANARGGLVS